MYDERGYISNVPVVLLASDPKGEIVIYNDTIWINVLRHGGYAESKRKWPKQRRLVLFPRDDRLVSKEFGLDFDTMDELPRAVKRAWDKGVRCTPRS